MLLKYSDFQHGLDMVYIQCDNCMIQVMVLWCLMITVVLSQKNEGNGLNKNVMGP